MPRVLLHLDHLVGDVVDLAHAVALSGQALLVPRGDAAERAVRVAAAARDERRDAVTEARRGLAAAVGTRELGEVGQGRVLGHDDLFASAEREARDRRERRLLLERAHERDEGLLGFLAHDRVDFGEIGQDFLRGERAEVTAHRDVPAVAAFAERDREREEIARSPLERERDADGDRRLGCVQDRRERAREVALEVERHELAPDACSCE